MNLAKFSLGSNSSDFLFIKRKSQHITEKKLETIFIELNAKQTSIKFVLSKVFQKQASNRQQQQRAAQLHRYTNADKLISAMKNIYQIKHQNKTTAQSHRKETRFEKKKLL